LFQKNIFERNGKQFLHVTLYPGVVGRVDSTFDSHLKDTGWNPTEASNCTTTVGKLFTPTVPSGAEGQLNQLTPGIVSTFLVTLGKSFTCYGSGLLSLSSLIGG